MLKEQINEFLEVQTQDVADAMFIAGSAKQEEVNEQSTSDILAFNIANSFNFEKKVPEVDFSEVIDTVVSSMTQTANSSAKESAFLEINEIENIKNSIDNSLFGIQIVSQVQDALSSFEAQIKENYSMKLQEYSEERILCENQIEALEEAKKEFMMKRLSQMLWPFDERTKKIDKKIEALRMQEKRCAQRESEMFLMEPTASEKDILIFKTKLEKKFLK